MSDVSTEVPDSSVAVGPYVRPSFSTWYDQQHPRLSAAILAATGDLDVAQDAVDEAFVRALERWDRVSEMASSEGWLYRVALNEVRRKAGRRKRERLLHRRSTRDEPDSLPGPAGELWDVVADLPYRQRQAVVLRHVADLSEADIAEAMGVTRSTVFTTLRSAHASLRNGLVLQEGNDDD